MSTRDVEAVQSRRGSELPKKRVPGITSADLKDEESACPTFLCDGRGGVRWGRLALFYLGVSLAAPFVIALAVAVLVGIIAGIGVLIGAE